jgi:predicted O-linked N-acetylglucosamine transferase (SPINDLY family)
LARGYVTFASFHTLAKLNDRLLEWWARILTQVPESRLLLVASGLDEASSRQRLLDFFAGHGIRPGRLDFKGRRSLEQYLATHGGVDLLLDCHPFTGHTIGCHALWMGVPVVTLAGETHSSRMVASVLANLGLSDLIARTPDEYVKIAAGLAGDLPRLSGLRSILRERMKASPLTDAPRFARHIEHAYREMWRAWCAKQSP